MNWKTVIRDLAILAVSIAAPLVLHEISELVIGDDKATDKAKKKPEGG